MNPQEGSNEPPSGNEPASIRVNPRLKSQVDLEIELSLTEGGNPFSMFSLEIRPLRNLVGSRE
jgi:hypothetical protein